MLLQFIFKISYINYRKIIAGQCKDYESKALTLAIVKE